MFGHYLAPEMVERLQSNPDLLKLGGEVKELTILFCDVRGFTTISEGMALPGTRTSGRRSRGTSSASSQPGQERVTGS